MTNNPDYRTAKMVCKLISFVGWITTSIGLVTLFVAIGISISRGEHAAATMAVIPIGSAGLSGLLAGLLLVAFGQLARANLDSADYVRDILSALRKRDT